MTPARLDAIAAYNEEDCLATLELRDWLLARRPEAEREHGVAIPFLPPEGRPAAEQTDEAPAKTVRLRDGAAWHARSRATAELCARLLEYHRREARPGWWWYFRRLHMTDEELADDGEALGCLEHDGAEPVDLSLENPRASRSSGRSASRRSSTNSTRETAARIRARKGPAGQSRRSTTRRASIRLRRSKKFRDEPLPTSLVPGGPIGTKAQQGRCAGSPASMLDGDGRYPHLERLLRRELPLGGASLQRRELEEQRALLDRLEGSYLVVQGPPGSGKTYRGARLITHLIAQGRKVGITAQSHKVIHNLLDEVERAAAEEGLDFRGVKRGDHWQSAHIKTSDSIAAVLDPEVTLVAGTAWLFAREELDGELDTLVVDEAGQYSLADALACGTSAKRLVLLGDPLQLAQVTQGVHPDGSGASVLEHVLGEHETIPEELGIFLEETRRMHPTVCRFVSEAFYEGRLSSIPECAERTTSGRRRRPLARGRPRGKPRRLRGGGGRDRGGDRAASSAIRSRKRRGAPARATRRDGRRAVQRAGAAAARAAPDRRRGRHGRQVPGPRGRGRLLLDGVVERRGRPARPRLPDVAQPAERRRLAGAVPRVRRVLAAAARGRLPDGRAPAARECTLPVRRDGGRP